ncbi:MULTISPECIES: hypothetical protein [unclassified Streptomyces]|uniref:hypothetical protein n=1 Tax=unclassified Streptomyces TaxID=2593676 RepID=UPI000695B208|nr:MULTISPECIES: hypothetical protein [unclassified Streptomyces]APU42496.1 hypothetical protein BSL84_24640 [Streptomyces sp. TN58]
MSTISMRTTTLGAVGLAVAGTLALTGCKNGNEELIPAPPSGSASAGAVSPSATAPSEAGSPSAGTDGSEAPAGANGTAKSGQTFKIGEAAEMPFSYGHSKGGQIALTVTAIEQGDPADLEPLKLGDKVKGMIPYYIRYSVKNTGTTDLSYSSVTQIKGLLGDGTDAQRVSVIGKFEKCANESLPKGFTNGRTQTSCALALAPSAQTKVTAAEYWGKPYSYPNKGLVWK